jgi:hypothetical protein
MRANLRRVKNRIKELIKPDGSRTENKQEMKEMTKVFCNTLYTSEGTENMQEVLNAVPRKVTSQMNDVLNAPYRGEEVKTALFQMSPQKAPGPDGFPAQFFQEHWDICSDKVTKVVLRIVEGVESAREINNTVLVFIPKVKKTHASYTVPSHQLMQCSVQNSIQSYC